MIDINDINDIVKYDGIDGISDTFDYEPVKIDLPWDDDIVVEYSDIEIEDLLQDMGTERHSKTLYRDEVIKEICAILISENKPNALLIGPAGSGKTHIIEELARRIKRKNKSVPRKLQGYTIYSLNLSDIVSGSGIVGDLEKKVKKLINYLEYDKRKAILFLDEIHIFFGGETYKKIAQILKPALSRGKIMVIGATTTQEVKSIESDPAFSRRFTRVVVDELTKEQTEKVLVSTIKGMEKHYGVRIGFDQTMAKLIVRTADEFCSVGSHRPDNALTLMDRSVASRVIELESKVPPDDQIEAIVLDAKLVEETAFRLTSGNSSIKQFDEKAFRKSLGCIHGQDDILDDITKVIKLYDMHLRPHDKPLTFLFAGPSGVGKSEVSKILAKEYTEEKPIILNMTEYSSTAAINRIIGSPAGYIGSDSNRELPFDILDSNPYKVILLDEFEKCDKSVQRLFMSVFDEGVMMTNFGKEIDFSKSIIIATTNAGCTEISGNIGFETDDESKNLSITDLSEYFDTELINRFSHIYTFHSITKPVYAQIIRECIEKEVNSLNLDKVSDDVVKRIRANIKDDTVNMLCERSYNIKLGARPAMTAIRECIDDMVLFYADSASCKTKSQPDNKGRKIRKRRLLAVETNK